MSVLRKYSDPAVLRNSRFFQLYMYTALAPIPLATFAGEGTSRVGWQYLKSYAGVCLQGAIIVIACIIYYAFAASPPQIADANASAVQMVWSYMGELIFNLLVLVGAVKSIHINPLHSYTRIMRK